MHQEAEETAKVVRERLNIPTRIEKGSLEDVARYTPNGGIFMFSQDDFARIYPAVERVPTLVSTPRDLYDTDVPFASDTWLYGYQDDPNLFVQSSARLKGTSSDKSQAELTVPAGLYLKRVATTAVHEIGHEIVKGEDRHFRDAWYVNEKEGIMQPLGPHCPDERCIMYEVIDLRAPTNGYEYLLLGGEKRFDAGNDDQLERLYDDWFCDDCRDAIEIGGRYFLTE